jgi:hypothetical protein
MSVAPYPVAGLFGAGQITTPASTQTLNFDGFNGSLGTLTGVQIDYTYQFAYRVSTTAIYDFVPEMSARFSLYQNLTAPGIGNHQSVCGAGGSCSTVYFLGRNALFFYSYAGTSPTFSDTVRLGPGSLSAYVASPVQITIADPGSADLLVLNAPNPQFIANSLRIDTAVTATLAYTYTLAAAVPEPGSWALFAAGLAAAGGIAHRRARRAALSRSDC